MRARASPRPPGGIYLERNYYRLLRLESIRFLYQVLDAKKTVLLGVVGRQDERTYKELEEVL